MGLEALGESRVRAADAAQLLGGGRRRPTDHHADAGHLRFRHGPFPVGGLPGLADADGERGVVRAAARVDLGHGRSTARAGLVKDAPELRLVLGDRLAGLVLGQLTATHEAADVHGARGGDAVDEGVHDGLGHRRVVALVVTATAVAHHVDDDVLVEGVAVLEGQVCAADDGLGVVCVHVQDRDLQALGEVGRVSGRAALRRAGREADLVVDDDVDRAAGLVALQLGEVEGLLDDALADERRVAVDQDGDDRQVRVAQVLLLGAHDAFQDAVSGLQVRGVGAHVDLGGQAVVEGVDTPRAQVVLDVARTLDGVRHVVAFELVEDLRVGLARDVGEHVEAAAVRHADGDLVDAGARRVGQDVVEQRDQGLAAFKREALLAHELGLEELLEGLGTDESAQDVALCLGGEGLVGALDALLDPGALLGILNVHVFDADRTRVGVVQAREDVAQQHLVGAAETARGEGTIQVPHAQAVGGNIEVGVASHAVGQRVRVGGEVSARTVGVDELRDARGLALLVVRVVVVVRFPRVGARGHVHRGEDALVEAVAARELGIHEGQEAARCRALDDAVIVGGREEHRLADAEGGQALGGHAAVFRRVVGGAHANDEALADHEARHGGGGAQRARVRQGDGGALEVGGRQRRVAGARDEVLVGVDELREGQGVSVVDDGDLQGVVALRVGHVNGQAEADVRELLDGGLAAFDRVAHVQVGHLAQCFHQRVADEVGEGDLAADRSRQVRVDEGTVFDEELGRDLALGGGRGDGERGLHVLGGRARRGLEDVELILRGGTLEEGEGRTPVLLARVGAGGLRDGGGRCRRQVRARHGDDGCVLGGGRLGSVLFDVEGRRGDRHGGDVVNWGCGMGRRGRGWLRR